MSIDLAAQISSIAAEAAKEEETAVASVEIQQAVLKVVQPAVSLHVAEGEQPVVAVRGGQPKVPEGFAWPHRHVRPDGEEQQDGRPLSFLAMIDLDQLAEDPNVPNSHLRGQLLFFIDDWDGFILYPNQRLRLEEQMQNKDRDDYRVIHIPSGLPLTEMAAPKGALTMPRVEMTAQSFISLQQDPPTSILNDDPSAEPIIDKIWDTAWGSRGIMQVFGHADGPQRCPRWMCPAQNNQFYDDMLYRDVDREGMKAVNDPENPLTYEQHDQNMREFSRSGGAYVSGSPDQWATQHTDNWTLLASFKSDNSEDMEWGDDGSLYFMIRKDDLAAGRMDRVFFTFQCC